MSEPTLRIAITGAAGYIAGSLIHQLQRSDSVSSILATDIKTPRAQLPSKARFARWDVATPYPSVFGNNRIDAVIHLAYILDAARRRDQAKRVNVVGINNILQACGESDVRHVIYLSSASVYGARSDNPAFLTETDPIRPLKGFQYSEDKADAESRLAGFAERNPKIAVTILRVCPVIGPNADNFIANAFKKPLLPIIGSSDPPMQFLLEDDLSLILEHCLKYKPRGIYNVAGRGTIAWTEMVATMDRPSLRLPAPVWRFLTAAAWHLRLQNESPACGLEFIRHRWTVDTSKIQTALNLEFLHTSQRAWKSYAKATKKITTLQK